LGRADETFCFSRGREKKALRKSARKARCKKKNHAVVVRDGESRGGTQGRDGCNTGKEKAGKKIEKKHRTSNPGGKKFSAPTNQGAMDIRQRKRDQPGRTRSDPAQGKKKSCFWQGWLHADRGSTAKEKGGESIDAEDLLKLGKKKARIKHGGQRWKQTMFALRTKKRPPA